MINWRYIGSKRDHLTSISQSLDGIEFETVLDVFGGSGVVSYHFSKCGKKVIYNDLLPSNVTFFQSMMTTESEIPQDTVDNLLNCSPAKNGLAQQYFSQYFSSMELSMMDAYLEFIHGLSDKNKHLLLFALSQAAIEKQGGFNFQDPTMNRRSADTNMNSTWHQPLDYLLKQQIDAVNDFLTSRTSVNIEFRNLPFQELSDIDYSQNLIFADPPFVPEKPGGRQLGNYVQSYHFNEFLVNYPDFDGSTRKKSKLYKFKEKYSLVVENKKWLQPEFVMDQFDILAKRSYPSTLVICYRNDGRVRISAILEIFKQYFTEMEVRTVDIPGTSVGDILITAKA